MNASVFTSEAGIGLLLQGEQSSINSPLRQHILDTRPARLGRNAQEYTETLVVFYTSLFESVAYDRSLLEEAKKYCSIGFLQGDVRNSGLNNAHTNAVVERVAQNVDRLFLSK